ncbi:MAG: 4'-phosphopantetheinyl transferase superfamily protein [Bacilli bacterium]|nr:4'-phosphopantetheinyl transferase superfamily protein [Bacilli bacterium]
MDSKYLSELEKISFQKYKNENVKKEKIVSAILKNKYIGDYHFNEYGKPISNNKYFNISHSDGYIALVIDQVPVGIDIENIRNAEEDLRNYISNDEEKKYIHDDESFFEVWTNKEALVKANGNGINQKIKTIQSLPLNAIRTYNNKTYFNKTIKYQNLVITVSRASSDDFNINIMEEYI